MWNVVLKWCICMLVVDGEIVIMYMTITMCMLRFVFFCDCVCVCFFCFCFFPPVAPERTLVGLRVLVPCVCRAAHLHCGWDCNSLTQRGFGRSMRSVVSPQGTRCKGPAFQSHPLLLSFWPTTCTSGRVEKMREEVGGARGRSGCTQTVWVRVCQIPVATKIYPTYWECKHKNSHIISVCVCICVFVCVCAYLVVRCCRACMCAFMCVRRVFFFFSGFWIHTVSAPITAETHTDEGAGIR